MSDLRNLSTLFNERVFRIPDYQRGFSWGKQQLEDFWDDLNRIPDGKNHYTGQITLEPVAPEAWQRWDEDTWLISDASVRPFYVVDGQQRLTTAIVLVKCLLDLFQGDETEITRTPKYQLVAKYLVRRSGPSRAYLFGYEKDNPSYEYLKTQILAEPSNQFQGVETVYTGNLLCARDFFRDKLNNLLPAQLEDLFKRLTQRLVFNEYLIQDDLDVFVAFETMNNRGKPLSRLELLKNRLIYLSTLIPANDQQRATLRRNINDAWKTVYEYLGKEHGHPLDDDEFLRAHWIMYFRYAREEAEQFASFLLNEHFTAARATSGALDCDELQRYVTSIQDASRAWYAVHFPTKATTLGDDLREKLDCLARVGHRAFAPLVMTALVKGSDEAGIVRLVVEAERFVFLIHGLCQRRADAGDRDFFRSAGKLFKDQQSIDEAIRQITDKTRSLFAWNIAQFKISQLFSEYSGFYSWKALRHFLFEYELYLKQQSKSTTAKINWDDFIRSKKDHVSVEHIYPQTPLAGQWPSFENLGYSERRLLLHSLGNLLALARKKNSSLQNRPFADKVRDAGGVSGYFNGSYSENEVSREPDWTPQQILERGLQMSNFMEVRWRVQFPSEQAKLQFLNLTFMNPPTT